MKGFLFDLNRCTGCVACELACSTENQLGWGRSWRQVVTFNESRRPDIPTFHLSMACNHCEEAPCLDQCPALAITCDDATGRYRSMTGNASAAGTASGSAPTLRRSSTRAQASWASAHSAATGWLRIGSRHASKDAPPPHSGTDLSKATHWFRGSRNLRPGPPSGSRLWSGG